MKVENDVLAVLSRAETNGCSLTLTGHLDRKLYERTNKVLEAAGGKWNKKAKTHAFSIDAADCMEQIILTGEVDCAKSSKSVAQLYGFFPTPPAVASRVLIAAEIRPGMKVLEPSAGTGGLAYHCAAAGAVVDCYEIQQGNAALMAMGAPVPLGRTQVADFLQIEPAADYDRVVMNPPFAKQDDIRHVMHALRFLKPTGKLAAVMSAGVQFRDNKMTTDFRKLVAERGGSIEALPEGAFMDSGTGVRTVLVTIPAAALA